MNVPEQIGQLSQALPPEKQAEILDFVEFLVARQPHTVWTVEQRQEIVARTMGCLRHTRTSSQAFAQRKQEEKPKKSAGGHPSPHPALHKKRSLTMLFVCKMELFDLEKLSK